jgi:hypothetical protein
VIHLDLHTGLGRWGTYKLLSDQPLNSNQRERLTRHFGRDKLCSCDPHGVAYHAQGDLGRWCVARFPEAEYCYFCAEFGTYDPLRVVAGLRTENQAHHWCQPHAPAYVTAKRRLQELFCPSAPAWRRRVTEQSLDLIRRGLNAVREPSER